MASLPKKIREFDHPAPNPHRFHLAQFNFSIPNGAIPERAVEKLDCPVKGTETPRDPPKHPVKKQKKLPEANIAPQENDGWEMSCPFCLMPYFTDASR